MDLTKTEEGCIVLPSSICLKTTEPIHMFMILGSLPILIIYIPHIIIPASYTL